VAQRMVLTVNSPTVVSSRLEVDKIDIRQHVSRVTGKWSGCCCLEPLPDVGVPA